MKTFRERVFDVVRIIPEGETLTYKEVAGKAGSPNAARAVGTIMRNNIDLSVPCHRVTKSDGTLGAYNGIRGKSKYTLLQEERARATIT